MIALSLAVACHDEPRPDPLSAEVTQDIQIADLVGPGATGFFPVGIFAEGHQVDVPAGPEGFVTNDGYFNGGVPVDPDNASRYYDEILRQMRSLGMNAMLMPNLDVIGVASDGHLQALGAKAAQLGSLYPIPMSRAIQGLSTPPGGFEVSADLCQSQAEGNVVLAVQTTLSATAASRHALAGFFIQDEPGEACLPMLRQVSKYLGLFDPAHSGFFSISSTFDGGYPGPPEYRGAMMDKVLGSDHVFYDDRYPFPNDVQEVGNVFVLEDWAGRIDNHYLLAPADKPLYYIIQTGSDAFIRKPTPAEIRYLTYTALARGVRGIFFYFYGAQHLPIGAGGPADVDYHLDETGREVARLGSAIRAMSPWLVEASRDFPRKNQRPVAATASRSEAAPPGCPSEGPAFDHDISSFTTRTGERLAMLVNEQLGACDPADILYQVTIEPGAAAALFANGSVTVRDVVTNTVVAGPTAGPTLAFSTRLSQGEGKLFHLQRDFSAEISIPRDAYHNPVAAPKAIKAQVWLKNTGAQSWTTSGANSTRMKIRVHAPDGSTSEIVGLGLGGTVASGQSTTVTVSIPTGTGTNITQSGVYELGFDLYKVTGNGSFDNEQRISVMVVPPAKAPLLVDTFDPVQFGSPVNSLHRWLRTGLMKIRGDKLAINGGNAAHSLYGDSWTNYTLEMDVMIDVESQHESAQLGWMLRAAENRGFVFILRADSDDNPSSLTVYQRTAGGGLDLVGTPHPVTIERGRRYRVKQTISGDLSVTISTQITPLDPLGTPTTIGVVTGSLNLGGGVGFYLNEPAYVPGAPCDRSIIGRCQGGPVAGTPCIATANCLGGGGICAGEDDRCYPGLARGHFDNVFVYETAPAPVAPAVTGLVTTSPSYPLSLSWNRPTSGHAGDAVISHYRVYRGSTCSFTPSAANLVGEPAATTFVHRTAGTFCYKVSAVTFANAEGPASSGVTGQVLAAPVAPTVTATVNHMRSVNLSWTAIAGAKTYQVYRGAPGFTPSAEHLIATIAATATSVEDGPVNMYVSDTQLGLTAFETYRYAVVPVPADGIPIPATTGFSANVTLPGSNLFSDAFDGAATKWAPSSGTWAVSGSAYVQSSTSCAGTQGYCTSRLKSLPPLEFPRMADVSMEVTVQIVADAGAGTGFAGMSIRKKASTDQYGAAAGLVSGYLVSITGNGTVELRSTMGAPVASKATGLSAMAPAKRRLRVDASGPRLKVFVDGIKYIDYLDPAATWSAGYMDLTTYRAHVQYHDVNVFFREGFSDLAVGVERDTFPCPAGQVCPPANWHLLGDTWLSNAVSAPDTYLEQPVIGGIHAVTYANPVSDVRIAFTVTMTSDGGDNSNWVGMTVRKSQIGHKFAGAYSGYLIYYRANGQVQIFNANTGNMATGNAPSPLNNSRKVWIQVEGGTIKVFVGSPSANDPPLEPVAQATDTAGAGGAPQWTSGYLDFTTYIVTAQIRNLSIGRLLPNWRTTSPFGTYDPRWMHQLRLAPPAGQGFTLSPRELKVADFTADFAVQIDGDNGTSSHWAGFAFRKTNPTDSIFTSGYLVAVRQNGELFLYPPMGPLGSCTIPSTTSYQQIRVRAQGPTIQVYVNGATMPCISVTGATAFPTGYVELVSSEAVARFEYLQIY